MRVFKKKALLSKQPWMNKRGRRERSRDDNRSQPNKGDDDRCQVDNIPLDLTLDILSRLPAKSIMRYRCVSKLWSSFTTLPSFINSFKSRSSTQPPRLLLTFKLDDNEQFAVSFPQNRNPDGCYSSFYGYHKTDISYYQHPESESVQGLILLGFRIWNPTLRRVFTLPHPEEPILMTHYNWKSYLGYDPLEGKHKVLCLYNESNYLQPLILTLGGQESWRIINKGRFPYHFSTGGNGRCFNGILYYEARVDDGQYIIMSFDFKSECFNSIKHHTYGHFRPKVNMIHYEGRLALVADDYPYSYDIDLYILKDEDGHQWTHQRLPRLPCMSEWESRMRFRGITDAGDELIFAPTSFVESFYILYFDPTRNITREAFFQGFLGDEFRGRHGVRNYYGIQCMSVFPNHMESLLSL